VPPILAFRIRWNDGLKTANTVIYGEEDRELTDLECEAIGCSYIMSSPNRRCGDAHRAAELRAVVAVS
jgi:hypothetical protein